MASVYRQEDNGKTVALSIAHNFPEPVAGILAEMANTQLDLVRSGACDRRAAQLLTSSAPKSLFPNARYPEAALSGLLLLLGCWDESHNVAQDIASAEGSYWHAIAHRIEPDSWNSGYWFRRVGTHPIFADLHRRAAEILQTAPTVRWRLKPTWDPFLFLEWCDEARVAKTPEQIDIARQIQTAEWELLFSWCATPQEGTR